MKEYYSEKEKEQRLCKLHNLSKSHSNQEKTQEHQINIKKEQHRRNMERSKLAKGKNRIVQRIAKQYSGLQTFQH